MGNGMDASQACCACGGGFTLPACEDRSSKLACNYDLTPGETPSERDRSENCFWNYNRGSAGECELVCSRFRSKETCEEKRPPRQNGEAQMECKWNGFACWESDRWGFN